MTTDQLVVKSDTVDKSIIDIAPVKVTPGGWEASAVIQASGIRNIRSVSSIKFDAQRFSYCKQSTHSSIFIIFLWPKNQQHSNEVERLRTEKLAEMMQPCQTGA